jgi:hypothetical protein
VPDKDCRKLTISCPPAAARPPQAMKLETAGKKVILRFSRTAFAV